LFGKKYSILCLAMLVFAAALNGCTKQENGMTFWQPVPETSNAEAETEVIREHQISSSLVNEGMDIMEATQAFPYADAEDSSSSEKDETTIFAELPELGPLSGVKSTDFVNVQWYIPQVQVELRYSQTNNFTGEIIYNFQDAYLRYGTVSKLLKVCEELEKQGLYLKIWDAFRPASAQFALWEICPDPQYVANPNRGYSSHTRGNTVDVTLVDAYGNELPMPSGYDDFTDAANREYLYCSEEARRNALLLEETMAKYGLQGYWGEWWHFSDVTQYEVEQTFDPGVISVWYPDCNEFITLREQASTRSDALNQIPLGTPIIVLGYTGQFALVEYMGQRGFVLTNYIKLEP